MEVCAGGTAEEPGGGFLLTLPPSTQVLISIYELPHVPTRPPPEGAKSVFTHNLHSLTRPSFTLTGTHGVYKAQQKYYSLIFSLLLLNRWITFIISFLFTYFKFKVNMKIDIDTHNTYM